VSTRAELRAALLDTGPNGEEHLRSILAVMCSEAHASGIQMEHLVAQLKSAWNEAANTSPLGAEAWHERYSTALVELLALYFGEPRT
jgi:hypothetical protein